MADSKPPTRDEGGGPAWIMTFADLMSLLMCFFVLLLSFAELDVMKFKAIAGSMKLAFGVQREIRAIEVPKGTSLIAQEFSAGKPEPTLISEVRQQTTDEDKQSLEFTDALVDDPEGTQPTESDGGTAPGEEQARLDAARLTAALQSEVDAGMIEIETEQASVIIRIREKGSFPSGMARFDPSFAPVVEKLRDSLVHIDGTIAVAGHTDDVPIRTPVYRSNWDLASARAVSVVHALLDGSTLDPARFVAEGHGEAHPLVANDSAHNRAQNRRVEITIRQNPESGTANASEHVDETAAIPDRQAGGPLDTVPDWVPGKGVPAWVPQAPAGDAVTLPLPEAEAEAVIGRGGPATISSRADSTRHEPGQLSREASRRADTAPAGRHRTTSEDRS
ncbi:MAG: flagellar motor protein MotB [Gammaproteobacteria bacterium]